MFSKPAPLCPVKRPDACRLATDSAKQPVHLTFPPRCRTLQHAADSGETGHAQPRTARENQTRVTSSFQMNNPSENL